MGFLDRIVSALKGFFGGNRRTPQEKVRGTSEMLDRASRPRGALTEDPANQPTIGRNSFSQTPQPSTLPDLQQTIEGGLQRFSQPPPPVATLSAELAQAGRQLPEGTDRLLPTILALMESRGLRDQRPAEFANPYNIMAPDLVRYQTPQQAILGGNGKLGLAGLLREGGLYQDYRESGDLSDFFTTFTPESDPLNPSTEELVRRYLTLRELFETDQPADSL